MGQPTIMLASASGLSAAPRRTAQDFWDDEEKARHLAQHLAHGAPLTLFLKRLLTSLQERRQKPDFLYRL